MPTFTTVHLENLVQPTVRRSLKKPLTGEPEKPAAEENGAPRHLYISPALYATPEQAPIPESSSPEPVSPSPYLANHKRRGGGNERRTEFSESPCGDETDCFGLEEEVGENCVDEHDDVAADAEGNEGVPDSRSEVDGSVCDRNQVESRSFVSAQGEFFDAIDDDFSSDGSSSNIPSYESRIVSELHASRITVLEEIERRKAAEETVTLMRSQWDRISKGLSDAGFTFPMPPPISDGMQLDIHLMDQMSEEIAIARFVSEVIGRGQARAEAEEAASAIIERKDQEILRLRDRVQYYETVNHEMSQRKLVEVARRQQERKKRRRRWVWSVVGLSVAIGASVAAYSFVPHATKYLSSLKSADSSHASSVGCSETFQGQE